MEECSVKIAVFVVATIWTMAVVGFNIYKYDVIINRTYVVTQVIHEVWEPVVLRSVMKIDLPSHLPEEYKKSRIQYQKEKALLDLAMSSSEFVKIREIEDYLGNPDLKTFEYKLIVYKPKT